VVVSTPTLRAWMCDLRGLTSGGDLAPRSDGERKERDAFLEYIKSAGGSDPMFVGSEALDEAIKKVGLGDGGGGGSSGSMEVGAVQAESSRPTA
jgi:hypothetical protein